MNNLMDVFTIIDKFTAYLKSKNYPFDRDGYPVFKKEMFLTEIPELVVPVNQRKHKMLVHKGKVLITFFCSDKDIYRRLDKLIDEIDSYKQYIGVVGCDVTITKDMEPEWQRVIMLLNLLTMAVFSSNGVKIVLNTRQGSEETRDIIKRFPKNVMAASGFRGGNRKYDERNFEYVSKILAIHPSVLLIYGSCDKRVADKLNELGVKYYQRPAFRDLCKEVQNGIR